MSTQPKIYVAGHRGMVGSAIVRTLQAQGHTHIVTRTHAELDLTDQAAVRHFLRQKNLIRFTWPQPRLVVSTPTTPTQPNLSTKT